MRESNQNLLTDRVYGLDILKALCAFCVIIIHIPFPGKTGSYIDALARIAVPVFFMITGYFYVDAMNRKREPAQMKKIFHLCIFANILYFLWNLLLVCRGGGVKSFFLRMIKPKTLLKFVAFNVSPFGGHLWYLGAILYVLIIVYFLNKVFPKYFSRILFIATPVLLLVMQVLDNYLLFFSRNDYPDYLVRNFLFMGIPYFTIGFYLRKYKEAIAKFSENHILHLSMTLFFAITTMIEVRLLFPYGLTFIKDHYLSTTFLSILVFSAFTSPYWNGKMQFLYHIGRKHSTNIYIIHLMVITVLNVVVRRFPVCDFFEYCFPVVVYSVSLLISMLLIRAQAILGSELGKCPSVKG
ncbi:MAG: acyltransferase [Faecousia sp.]